MSRHSTPLPSIRASVSLRTSAAAQGRHGLGELRAVVEPDDRPCRSGCTPASTSSTRSCSSTRAGGEVDLAHQVGQAGAGAEADMALDQPQPGAGAQPHDDARMAHERRRLADGQEQQLQRLLGVGAVVELDPGAGTGEGAVERGERPLVLEPRRARPPPAAGRSAARAARLITRTPRGQALHVAELGHDVAVDEDQPPRLVAAQEIGG